MQVLHIVADGLSQVFAFCALLLDIPIVGKHDYISVHSPTYSCRSGVLISFYASFFEYLFQCLACQAYR